jgi:hypothetical protein
MEENPLNYVNYLLRGIQWNDSLILGYRSFHLTLQSIFIAIGAGMTVASLNSNKLAQSALACLIFVALAIIGVWISFRMHKIIKTRSVAVDAWQRELIKAERGLPREKRRFTQSKIDGRGLALTVDQIDDDKIGLLVGGEGGYEREILDKWMFIGIRLLWFLLFVINIGYLGVRMFGIS